MKCSHSMYEGFSLGPWAFLALGWWLAIKVGYTPNWSALGQTSCLANFAGLKFEFWYTGHSTWLALHDTSHFSLDCLAYVGSPFILFVRCWLTSLLKVSCNPGQNYWESSGPSAYVSLYPLILNVEKNEVPAFFFSTHLPFIFKTNIEVRPGDLSQTVIPRIVWVLVQRYRRSLVLNSRESLTMVNEISGRWLS